MSDAAHDPSTYDPSAFDRPSVTVDIVAFTASAGRLHALLIRRGVWPFAGEWALPGGFVRIDEALDAAAERELREETGTDSGPELLEQLYTFGAVDRDPRTRVISVAYWALMPPPPDPKAGTDADEARWWPVDALPPLAFDHGDIVRMALERLRGRLGYSSVAWALLPEAFTLTELQTIYEVILGQSLDKRNFRKKLASLDLLEGLDRQRRDGAHRPAQLFRFKERTVRFFG